MSNRSRIAFRLVCVLSVAMIALLGVSGTVLAADAAAPTVSKGVAKPLKAAQDALVAKNFDEAIAHIKEAQAVPGEKSAYDQYAMNGLLLQAYNGKHDTANVVPVLQQLVQSQYTSGDQRRSFYKFIAGYEFQEKDYAKALDAANDVVKNGGNDVETQNLIAKSQYLTGKYKEAAVT